MRLRRRILSTIAAVAAGAIAFTGCSASGEPTGGGGGEDAPTSLTIAARQDVATFDTGNLDTGFQVQYWQPVYDTLLKYSPDGTVEPNMATEFSYNDDNTVLTLKLRDGITFTDGTVFDASVVKANIEHLQQGSGVSVYMVGSVESVDTPDDSTVVITLAQPDPAFTYYLALVAGAMASPAAFGTDSFATAPIGSGPYTLDADATIRGSQYVFVRNADYWNPERYPYDKITVKPMDDLTARYNAIKSGQVNVADLDPSLMSDLENTDLNIGTARTGWLGLIIFDRDGSLNKALGDVRVRQALNYAIDGSAIVDNLFEGQGSPSQQIFNPLSAAYVEANDNRYPYDVEKAKALLAEAGYASGFDLVLPDMGDDITQPYVNQQLQDIGVNVIWEKVAPENIVPELLGGKYAAASFGSSSGHPWRDISKLVAPSAAWNPLGSETPELNDLLEKVRYTTDAEQAEAYRAVNDYVTENAWFGIWLFSNMVMASDNTVAFDMQSGSGVPYIANYRPVG